MPYYKYHGSYGALSSYMQCRYYLWYRIWKVTQNLSQKDMITQLSKLYKEELNISDKTYSVENTYDSMIDRNSKLYPIILNFLEINEDIIATCYFSHLDATDLFLSLSSRNQSAILFLMQNLDTDFSIKLTSGNINVQGECF